MEVAMSTFVAIDETGVELESGMLPRLVPRDDSTPPPVGGEASSPWTASSGGTNAALPASFWDPPHSPSPPPSPSRQSSALPLKQASLRGKTRKKRKLSVFKDEKPVVAASAATKGTMLLPSLVCCN